MKKIITTLSILTIISSASIAQQRNSLLEVFSSSTCGPCRPGNEAMKAVLPSIDNYTIVKYQQNFPGSGDPYYTAESVARRNYYGINSIPRMEIDGQWDQNAASFTKQVFDAFNVMPTNLEFKFNVFTYDPASKQVVVDVDIIPSATDATATLRYMLAIVEKETTGNVASNGETKFEHIFMTFMPSNGSGVMLSGGLTNGVAINKVETFNMSTTFIEEITDLRAVVWVEDMATKKIINSDWMDLRDVVFTGVEEEENFNNISVYPNPFRTQATIEFDLEESSNIAVNVYDITGKLVSQFENRNYSVGNHQLIIDGSKLLGGLYYVNILTDSNVITRKLVLDK